MLLSGFTIKQKEKMNRFAFDCTGKNTLLINKNKLSLSADFLYNPAP